MRCGSNLSSYLQWGGDQLHTHLNMTPLHIVTVSHGRQFNHDRDRQQTAGSKWSSATEKNSTVLDG